MYELDILKTIQPIWMQRTVQVLAKGPGVRDDLVNQLERFFNLLQQAVESGDQSWMDSILSSWSSSLTQTDLENANNNLTHFISELFLITIKACRETLDETGAIKILDTISPLFMYCIAKATQFELEARISYVSNQLSQMQKSLEKLDRSKSDFIAVAAHELKTPLTLIEGYASMLAEQDLSHNPQNQNVILLDGIHKGILRMKGIINDMIDVSLIDNNLLKLNLQPVWLNRLLEGIRKDLESTTQGRHQELIVSNFPGDDQMIFADPEKLLQVFRNVLMNAVKYTPDGGKIIVDGRSLPGFSEVTITDTGIGIDLEDQPNIFEKFSRLGDVALHSSGKTKFKGGGPGLGLHIARGIIEAHRGAIWVESPGYDEIKCPGSTFHILLPTHLEPADEKIAKLFKPLMNRKLHENDG